VTEVLRGLGQKALLLFLCAVLGSTALSQQGQLPASTNVTIQAQNNQKAAEQLYLQLRAVGLDPARIYQVRDASLDRDQLHISLDDGTIAFTQDVDGRVTGAFFEGEGEILVVPPNQAERASMMLFTGAAILEERFATAYFRFNDDTFVGLKPNLRPFPDGKDFAAKWDETAHNLAEWDALRLFVTFSRFLPSVATEAPRPTSVGIADHFLHARVQGMKLGSFDAYYDSTANEPIAVAQQKRVDAVNYYNVWAAFPTRPAEPNPADQQAKDEIAIRSYRIRAEVKPPTTLSADASLQVEVLQGGVRALLFELSRFLKVSEVKVDGRPVEFIQNQALEGSQLARRGNDILAVVFPHTIHTGQKMELSFSYAGDVLSEAGGGLLYVGARGIWYPNRGLSAADFDVQFQYPSGWTLLATGNRASEEPLRFSRTGAEGEQVSRWVTERPIPVAGFNLGRYTKAVAQAGQTTVETYAAVGVERSFPKAQAEAVVVPTLPSVRPQPPRTVVVAPPPPPSPARNAQVVADTASRAVEFFAREFGPFPYSTLKLTQMPGLISQGWPGLVFLSSFAFLSPEERSHLHLSAANEILDQLVTAHEAAHQWWGDLVFWKGYRDQWMFEGLANYCSLMLLESENPANFRVAMEKYREDLMRKNKAGVVLKDAGPVTLGVRLSSSEFPEGYEAISYGRGTWLFHMLRHILNDSWAADRRKNRASSQDEVEPFVRALRKVRQRYAGEPITTWQLLQVFAEELPESDRYEGRKSLEWFYEGWVNGTALPRFELQGVRMAPKANSVAVSGTILQKDAPKELVTSVPIYAAMPGERRVFLGRVFADGPESSFRLTAPQGTKRLLVDPEQTILTSPR
jgi:hypothetical protein